MAPENVLKSTQAGLNAKRKNVSPLRSRLCICKNKGKELRMMEIIMVNEFSASENL